MASEQNAGQRLVIWGTDVNVGTCKEKFQVAPNDRLRRAVIIARYKPTFSHRLSSDCEVSLCVCVCVSSQRFLQRFIDPTSREDENASLDLNEPLYMQKLDEVGFSFRFSRPVEISTNVHVQDLQTRVCVCRRSALSGNPC